MKKKLNGFLLAGLIITGVILLITVIGMFWTPYPPTAMKYGRFQPPTLQHLFGTDNFGRDIFSRVIKGSGTTLAIALSTVSIGAIIGTLVGGSSTIATAQLAYTFGMSAWWFTLGAGIACLWTYSRGSIAIMPVGYGIVALACLLAKRPKTAVLKRVAPILLVGFLGFVVMLPRLMDRFANAPEASSNTRVELARCAMEMIIDEPVRGVGIHNWGIKINPPYDYAALAGRIVPEGMADGVVETVYLLVGAECGLPALAAMLIWFGWYLVLAIVLMRRLWGTRCFFIAAGAAGGLTMNYLQSILEWVLRQQMNLVCLMGVFAVLSYLGSEWRSLVAAEKKAVPLGKEGSR